MIRHYLAPYIGTGTQRDAYRPAYFAASQGIKWDFSRDEESRYWLVSADVDEAQHQEILLTEGIIYVGVPGETVASRPQIIDAGYPVDPGEPVDRLVTEIKNQMWMAMRRARYHSALRSFGLDPATRPTKAQEVAAARAGIRAPLSGSGKR